MSEQPAIEGEIVPTPNYEVSVWDRKAGVWRILQSDAGVLTQPKLEEIHKEIIGNPAFWEVAK